MLTHGLHVDVRHIIDRETLSFVLVEPACSVLGDLVEPFTQLLVLESLLLAVHGSQEFIVLLVSVQLQGMLVVSK